MRDLLLFSAVVLTFAVAVTAHVTIAYGLAHRSPKKRALVGFLVAPLGPYWAWREGMHVRAVAWLVGVGGYAIAWLVQRS